MLPASIPPEEQHDLMKVTFDVLCAAQYQEAELLGADLIILLKAIWNQGFDLDWLYPLLSKYNQ